MSINPSFDLVLVGRGIAGSSLAFSMAKSGASVLLLESESQFSTACEARFCALGASRRLIRSGLTRAFQDGGAIRQTPPT